MAATGIETAATNVKTPATVTATPPPSNRLHPDARRSKLRTKMAAVELALGEGATIDGALKTAWADLTAALDLGPEPVMRRCPHCDAIAYEHARRCGECWGALTA